ncbi:Non-histone chromosomal protein 6 [Clydaea vesicula]|uniref:Non-histone chromosomal protein 6 n=1 Tax=Clydaea vesicula TaxID=447962 RepID=A0AAD5TV01_9FUNG|nr:Non-histone chromosomal protein 6 [Clydaea vesicula]KAJ3377596.1 Non-histone chromosomal protein 6 [Lobulomyces angularis]
MPKDEKKKRVVKRKKDPNAPKKNLSAFMFFSQSQRPIIKAEKPDAGFGELGKLLGEAWRNLPEEEKAVYQEKADKDKVRYAEAAASYKGQQEQDVVDEEE